MNDRYEVWYRVGGFTYKATNDDFGTYTEAASAMNRHPRIDTRRDYFVAKVTREEMS